MKSDQLKLPFGQRAKQIKSVKTKTESSPIKISELQALGITTATTLSAEVILELAKRYDQEAYTIHGALHNPSDVYNTYKVRWLVSRILLTMSLLSTRKTLSL
jgi:DNA repair protein RadC